MDGENIRWMERKDMSDAVRIDVENSNKKIAWTENDFINELREKNTVGQVIEIDEGKRVAGFMVYLLQTHQLIVLHMAVAKSYQRQGLGTMMIDKLKSKLRAGRRTTIIFPVRETFLNGQLFLKSNSFKAVCVSPENYVDTGEDAFIFKYELPQVGSLTEVAATPEETVNI